jgi:hypothetical protein
VKKVLNFSGTSLVLNMKTIPKFDNILATSLQARSREKL